MEEKKGITNCMDCGVQLEFKYKGNPPKRCKTCNGIALKKRQREREFEKFDKKLAEEKALKNG